MEVYYFCITFASASAKTYLFKFWFSSNFTTLIKSVLPYTGRLLEVERISEILFSCTFSISVIGTLFLISVGNTVTLFLIY